MYVKNVYAYHRSDKDRFEQGFPWWQLGEFTSSAIDVANMNTLQQLCTRLIAIALYKACAKHKVEAIFIALLAYSFTHLWHDFGQSMPLATGGKRGGGQTSSALAAGGEGWSGDRAGCSMLANMHAHWPGQYLLTYGAQGQAACSHW